MAYTNLIDLVRQVTGLLPTANGGVPAGGTTGQALVKNSNSDNDVGWSGVSGGPYDIAIKITGRPNDAEIILEMKMTRAVTFAIALALWTADIQTNPTDATATFTFKKNGSSFGTLAITTGGALTWTSASGATFAAGDTFQVVAPTPQDSSLADICIVAAGTR